MNFLHPSTVSVQCDLFCECSYTNRTLELEQEIQVDFQFAGGEDANLLNGYSLYNDVEFQIASVGGKIGALIDCLWGGCFMPWECFASWRFNRLLQFLCAGL